MAKCGCAGGTCSCKMDSTQYDGTGTAQDPYVLHVGDDVVTVPLTGETTLIGADESAHYFNHLGTIAAHTVTLPTLVTNPTMFMQEVTIVARSAITALTVNAADGYSVTGAPTTLAAGGFFKMRHLSGGWRRVG